MKACRQGAGIDVILEEAEGNEGLEERGSGEMKSWREETRINVILEKEGWKK